MLKCQMQFSLNKHLNKRKVIHKAKMSQTSQIYGQLWADCYVSGVVSWEYDG